MTRIRYITVPYEPTAAMLDAANRARHPGRRTNYVPNRTIWQAMIDACTATAT